MECLSWRSGRVAAMVSRARAYDGRRPPGGKWPAVVSGGPSGMSLHNRQAHIHIAARGVGIGAYLVSLLDQRFRIGTGKAGQRNGEVDVEAKAAGRTRPDTDRGGHRRIGGKPWAGPVRD